MSQQIEKETVEEWVERRYNALEEVAKSVPGVSPDVNTDKPPTWYDQEKFLKSQKLAYKYFTR